MSDIKTVECLGGVADISFGTDGRMDTGMKAISIPPLPTSGNNKLKLNKQT